MTHSATGLDQQAHDNDCLVLNAEQRALLLESLEMLWAAMPSHSGRRAETAAKLMVKLNVAQVVGQRLVAVEGRADA